MPQLSSIQPKEEQDIDVLFYGCMNERRFNILNRLHTLGFKVTHLYGAYGVERDRMMARSKIVLNVHFYESKIFEVVRVSYLLANGVCVVSEEGLDPDETEFEQCLAFAPCEQRVETCVRILRDAAERRRIASAGRALMQSRRQADFLRPLLNRP